MVKQADSVPQQRQAGPGEPVAIVGMAGRFPGASNIEDFRCNLMEGVESISFFDEAELRAVDWPEAELADPDFVPAVPVLGGTDLFDAGLFGLNAREAQLLDPQYRVFLEVCHEALQNGGVVPRSGGARIGVYAGSKHNAYMDGNVSRNAAVMRATGAIMAIINNHTDYLATGVAYRLGLTGPAVTMVTACSTSLVAVHSAVQALRAGECEIALAGGVEIDVPEVGGYVYKEGGLYSPDGHIRPFDAKARGTVFGSGCGAVVLKRLDDALADGNPIHAVIRGSAINNDGNAKSGFFAPSRAGQVAVINAALANADVDPATVGYVEAHGTGTLVGDPTEVGALSDAFRQHTDKVGYCAIASVKSNVGHLGAAAGITGLINAVCTVRDGVFAPIINFDEPNPLIGFGTNPFYVNLAPKAWESDGPRRAAISSFGIGGTNANVIIEQAPDRPPSSPSRRSWQLLPISGNTPEAVDAFAGDLAAQLTERPAPLADAAYTLATGRATLKFRTMVVARDAEEAAQRLRGGTRLPVQSAAGRTAAFLFPGQGSQYPGMAAGLYDSEPVFRAEVDACAALLRESAGLDLHALMKEADAETLSRTKHAQPVLFAVEYALARTLIEAGITPTAMAGHSVGEYVAATLAGVFTREDALRLVAQRGALMQSMAPGAMVAVNLPEELLDAYVGNGLDVAAVNAPGMCVLSGSFDDVRQIEDELSVQGIGCKPLHTSHAFHSRMMEPMLADFGALVAATPLNPPAIPFVSNTTGTWIGDDEATDPEYWVRHLRSCVRFSDTIALLTTDGTRALVEVGPGRTLTGLVQAHDRNVVAVPTLSHPQDRHDDVETMVSAVGRMWTEGVDVDWSCWWAGERRELATLPPYPYQRQRYWIEPDQATEQVAAADPTVNGPFTTSVWVETAPLSAPQPGGVWAVLADPADPILARTVVLAEEAGIKTLVADSPTGLVSAVANMGGQGEPVTVVHALTVGSRPAGTSEAGYAGQWLERGFHSLLDVVQEFTRRLPGQAVDLVAVSSDMQDVAGDGRIEPAKAALLGLVKVAPREVDALTCRSIDVAGDGDVEQIAGQLVAEIDRGTDVQVAYRGRKRWTWSFGGLHVDAPAGVPSLLEERGVYVVTGGLGGLGLSLCKHLGDTVAARLAVLTTRPMPEREHWPSILAEDPDGLMAARVRGIMAAEEAGAELLVLQADVTDEAALRTAAATVWEQFGPVDGVFHLAAVAGGAMLETRDHEDAARVLAPKVAGTYLLEDVFGPPLMVLYSTVAVFSADFGLGDYVGANAVLDAFAQSRHGKGRHVLSINWPPFDDVGMAAVIAAPAVLGPLLLGDSAPDGADQPAESPSSDLVPAAHPMLLGRHPGPDGGTARFEVNLSPQLWVLAEHRLGGVHTMPGTGIIELIRAGYTELTGQLRATVRNVVFQRPLRVFPGMRTWLELVPDGTGGYYVTVTSGTDIYSSGHVGAGPAEPAEPLDVVAARDGFVEDTVPPTVGLVKISFGPRWQGCMRRRWSGPGCEILELELDEQFHADLEAFTLHPAALDCAVSLGQTIRGEGMYLPFSYEEVAVHAPLPARFYSVVRHRDDTTADLTTADMWLVDEEGVVVVTVRGFGALRIDNAFANESMMITLPASGSSSAMASSEQGAEALRQMLAARVGPQVAWSPENLAVRIRRSAQVTRAAITAELTAQTGGAAAGAGRSLSNEYVAPAGEVEVALADLWSQTLGVERIGAEDDFFDLGGNSLFAVQLVSRIGQRFSIEASAALLFDSRNIRALAAAIEDLLLAKVANLSEEEAVAALRTHAEVTGV